jgi:hypothetical protein
MDWWWQCGHFGTKHDIFSGCLAAWQWQWQCGRVAVLTVAVAGWQWEWGEWIGGGSAVILVPNMLCFVAVWQWQWQFGAVVVAVAVWHSGSFDSGSGRVAVGVGGMDWGDPCGHFGTKHDIFSGCLAVAVAVAV